MGRGLEKSRNGKEQKGGHGEKARFSRQGVNLWRAKEMSLGFGKRIGLEGFCHLVALVCV
jgi:hypothetical protein